MFVKRQDLKSSYDVIVVGAGPAGMVFAKQLQVLTSNALSILIVESGDAFSAKSDAQKLSHHNATGDLDAAYYPLHNQRVLGGTSVVWNGYCSVLEQRSFISGEWPIEYQELAQYYPAAAAILELPDSAYTCPEVPFLNAEQIIYKPYFLSPPKRFNDQDTQAWLAGNKGVNIVTNCTVDQINVESELVHSLQLKSSLIGDRFVKSLTTNKVVLATGGIQNARILEQAGLKQALPALGAYFCEHPHVYRELELGLDYERCKPIFDLDQSNIIPAISLSSAFSHQHSLVSSTLDLPTITIESENLGGQRRKIFKARSTVRAEMSAVETNLVSRSEVDKDFLGRDIATINIEFNAAELERSVRALSEQLLRTGLGRLSLLPERYDITGGGHMMGTTRMGKNDKTSVVNSDCKVHNINNLFVAGSSVYPAAAAANPTFTIVALSLRLAAHVAKQFNGSEPGHVDAA